VVTREEGKEIRLPWHPTRPAKGRRGEGCGGRSRDPIGMEAISKTDAISMRSADRGWRPRSRVICGKIMTRRNWLSARG
jgi:hypothetical protein